MRPLLIALQFLTRLPLSFKRPPKPAENAASTAYFPLAGLALGLWLLALRQLTLLDPERMHDEAWALLLCLVWVWSGNSLHLDGLSDTLDGLASGQKGKAMLKVMHDHAAGAFGVMGVAFSLLARFVLLYSLPNAFLWWLPLPFIVSRLAQSLACASYGYAGQPGSLSAGFIKNAGPREAGKAVWLALASLLGLAVLQYFVLAFTQAPGLLLADRLGKALLAWWLPFLLGLLGAGLGLAAGWLALREPRLRLGGVSGDLVGYASETAELATFFLLVLLLVR